MSGGPDFSLMGQNSVNPNGIMDPTNMLHAGGSADPYPSLSSFDTPKDALARMALGESQDYLFDQSKLWDTPQIDPGGSWPQGRGALPDYRVIEEDLADLPAGRMARKKERERLIQLMKEGWWPDQIGEFPQLWPKKSGNKSGWSRYFRDLD